MVLVLVLHNPKLGGFTSEDYTTIPREGVPLYLHPETTDNWVTPVLSVLNQ
jgi:hypothetical protein